MAFTKSIFNLRDASDYLNLSEDTLERLANQGFVQGKKVGRGWKFPGHLIRDMAENRHFLHRITFKARLS